jgi:branched-chain amino acid transport system permease protein
MYRFLDAVVRGVQTGSVYGLVGLGINIIFGATGVFNFAQGDMVMVGGMLGVTLWIGTGLPFPLAMLIVVLVAGAIGGATEVVAVRGTARFKQSTVLWVISTLGVSIIIESVTSYLLSRHNSADNGTKACPPYVPWHSFSLGKLLIIPQRAIIFPIALVLTAVISFCFQRTLWGRALSAMAFDREGAAMRGIPVGRLAVLAFILGGAVAGFGGFAAGPITQASVNIGFAITLQGFIAATIGGIPRLWGPILGGVLLGLAVQFTTVYWDAAFTNVVALGLLLVVLLVKPNGILGRTVRTL